MTVHVLYKGGDKRHAAAHTQHSRVAGNSNKTVRYAAHLMNRDWVLPYVFDAGAEHSQEYRRMHGGFANGDVIHTHLLSRDTLVERLVFINKKATGVVNKQTGSIETAAKIKIGLYDGETMVKETEELDLSNPGRLVVEFGNARPATPTTLSADSITTPAGVMLKDNGTIRITVTQGNLDNGCHSLFLSLVDYLDVEGCTCVQPPCEVDFPTEPKC